MIKEILIIIACVPLYIVNSFCDKAISSRHGNKHNFIYNCVKFLICSFCMLPILIFESSFVFQLGSFVCGVLCGIMYVISKTIMLKGYERTSIAFMTLCHSSGMLLPCLIGHFFWSEKLKMIAFIGIVLVIISILLLKDSKKSENKKYDVVGIIFGVIILLSSGGVMIAQKIIGRYYPEQSVTSYNFYSFFVAFLILCFFIKRRDAIKSGSKGVFICAVGSGVSLSVISLVMTSLAGKVPSVLLFPLFNGLGIIFVCIGSAVVFKEKMTTKKLLGLLVGVLGLSLVNF